MAKTRVNRYPKASLERMKSCDNVSELARDSLYDVHAANSRGVGGLSSVSAGAGLNDVDHTLAFSNVYSISTSTVNETRAQFTHSTLLAAPNDAVGPAASTAGFASFVPKISTAMKAF